MLGFYVIKNINLKKDWQNIIKILSIGIIFESFLSILQFLNQSSINGIFYWIGERSFTISTPSIAKTTLDGVLLLRPYGTFPHPNTLGGYLAVLLPIILAIDFRPAKIKWLAFALGLSALFLTFSRTAFVLGSLGILIAWFLEKRKYKLILVFLACFVVFMTQNISLEKESIERRTSLNNASMVMLQEKTLFGVGLGNFIPNLPSFSKDKEVIRFLQPAHNIYLLTLAETGAIGFILFITVILFSIKKLLTQRNFISFLILNSLFIILILGMFDHYFITLQQTQALFTIIVSLSLVKYPHEV